MTRRSTGYRARSTTRATTDRSWLRDRLGRAGRSRYPRPARHAEAHARAAAAVSKGDALAVLINILIEQGRLQEARRRLDQYPLADDVDHLMLQPIRAAAGRLAMAEGRTREGIDHLLACGRWLDAWPIKNPSVVPWRSTAALALDNDHERDHARRLARQRSKFHSHWANREPWACRCRRSA